MTGDERDTIEELDKAYFEIGHIVNDEHRAVIKLIYHLGAALVFAVLMIATIIRSRT